MPSAWGAADHLVAQLPIRVDVDGLYGALEPGHAAADGSTLKGRAGRAGGGDQPTSIVHDELGVRSDIHEGRELSFVSELFLGIIEPSLGGNPLII